MSIQSTSEKKVQTTPMLKPSEGSTSGADKKCEDIGLNLQNSVALPEINIQKHSAKKNDEQDKNKLPENKKFPFDSLSPKNLQILLENKKDLNKILEDDKISQEIKDYIKNLMDKNPYKENTILPDELKDEFNKLFNKEDLKNLMNNPNIAQEDLENFIKNSGMTKKELTELTNNLNAGIDKDSTKINNQVVIRDNSINSYSGDTSDVSIDRSSNGDMLDSQNVENTIEEANTAVANAQDSVSNAENEYDSANSNVSKIEGQISELETRRNCCKDDRVRAILNSKINAKKTQLSEAQSQKRAAADKLETAQNNLAAQNIRKEYLINLKNSSDEIYNHFAKKTAVSEIKRTATYKLKDVAFKSAKSGVEQQNEVAHDSVKRTDELKKKLNSACENNDRAAVKNVADSANFFASQNMNVDSPLKEVCSDLSYYANSLLKNKNSMLPFALTSLQKNRDARNTTVDGKKI